MAKLSELQSDNYFRGLVYGSSGAGKTCLAGVFAKDGPVEILDFEGKVASITNHFKNDKAVLDSIEVKQFNKLGEKEKIPAWLSRMSEIELMLSKGQTLPFKTLILDSITAFTQSLMRDYVVRSLTTTKRANEFTYSQSDYGYFKNQLISIIPNCLLRLPCNVLVLGHLETEKDDSTGVISRKPMMPGKNAEEMPRWFDEVYVLKVAADGQRVLQAQPDSQYPIVRTQRGKPKEFKVEDILK